jgi:hypothetical protein
MCGIYEAESYFSYQGLVRCAYIVSFCPWFTGEIVAMVFSYMSRRGALAILILHVAGHRYCSMFAYLLGVPRPPGCQRILHQRLKSIIGLAPRKKWQTFLVQQQSPPAKEFNDVGVPCQPWSQNAVLAVSIPSQDAYDLVARHDTLSVLWIVGLVAPILSHLELKRPQRRSACTSSYISKDKQQRAPACFALLVLSPLLLVYHIESPGGRR